MSWFDQEKIAQIGFNQSQLLLYFAILFLGDPSRETLSKVTDLSSDEVERTLLELQKIGLVKKADTTPPVLKASTLEVFAQIIKDRRVWYH
ncbi:MAG: hypothetical protein NWE93_00150 [Candidatus Bathyarchaeota archaeon]|nr:hypothetical protein [Candidatus Bathyarchaeota archaeon]